MSTRHFIAALLAAASFLAGCKEKNLDPDPEPEPEKYGYGLDVATPHWLELPATKSGDGKEWFAHDMEGGDYMSTHKGVRNWSFDYDYGSMVSSWVAYPLNYGLIGSGSRSDAWGYDPLVPMNLQQNIITAAYGTGHTRGHQIPSADRLDRTANVSTFYATNMTPQEADFNGGVWSELEKKVRTYAKACDTLYVVTGCVIDATSQTIPDKMNHKVKVPSAYYKALLRYDSSKGYIACGFYLPHDSSIPSTGFMGYIMSVDELETRTGMEFFKYLPEKVGAAEAARIKSQTPDVWWNR